MLEFHAVEAQDGRWAAPLLQQGGYDTCEYSFTDIFMWSAHYGAQIARWQDFVTVRSRVGDTCQYLFPAGLGERKAMVQQILQDAEQRGCRAMFYGTPGPAWQFLQEEFPGVFEAIDQRDHYDYLYRAQDLAELPGKKFQKKRNHVSRFMRTNPNWQFQLIGPENLEQVREFSEQWYAQSQKDPDSGIEEEHKAVNRALDHYETLGLKGGFLTSEGQIVAYSFGTPINSRVFDTQVEKALYTVDGAYAMINREMARNCCSGFEYINREDDVGDEGLRKAKLSYNPELLAEKWLVKRR